MSDGRARTGVRPRAQLAHPDVMRTVLLALCLGGCSCAASHTRGDASVALDGASLDAGDAALDAGEPPCAEYARRACAAYEACHRESIWLFGSLERCEAILRGFCEHDSGLDGVGDIGGALLGCVETYDEACDWARDRTWCRMPPGARAEGEPCRSDLQCSEGLLCFRASEREPACDSGTCRAPLVEGATGCDDSTVARRCDEGLRCAMGTCVVLDETGAEGDLCPAFSRCDQGLYCARSGRCEPEASNGAACDPDAYEQCGSPFTWECDRDTATCVAIEYAFAGDACGPDGPRCGGACVEGVCTPYLVALGETCTPDSATVCAWVEYGCFDGVCGPEPCD